MDATLDEETLDARYYVNRSLHNSKNAGNAADSRRQKLLASVLKNSYPESFRNFSRNIHNDFLLVERKGILQNYMNCSR